MASSRQVLKPSVYRTLRAMGVSCIFSIGLGNESESLGKQYNVSDKWTQVDSDREGRCCFGSERGLRSLTMM